MACWPWFSYGLLPFIAVGGDISNASWFFYRARSVVSAVKKVIHSGAVSVSETKLAVVGNM